MRPLAALAAVLAPRRAERLLGLLATPVAAEAVAEAGSLATRTRGERLAALSAALAGMVLEAPRAPRPASEVLLRVLLREPAARR